MWTIYIGIIISTLVFELSFVDAQCRSSPTQVGGSLGQKGQICSGQLIFSENFDDLNQNLWNHEYQVDGAGNGEFQQYVNSREISFVRDGNLNIKPKVVGDQPLHDGYFNPVQSARLNTNGKFTFKYGRLEARAKIPEGDWIWPAIWMMPQDSRYGGWPRSGKIDILESRGNKNLVAWGGNIGTQLVLSTLHWGKSSSENNYQKTQWQKRNSNGFNGDFHKYEVEWTPDYIAFKVDGQEIGRVTPPNGGFYEFGHLSGDNPWSNSKMAPFDQNFYIIVNVAIGATNGYFPDEMSNPNGKPWKNSAGKEAAREFWNGNQQWRPTWNDQSVLKVDYIKVWAI